MYRHKRRLPHSTYLPAYLLALALIVSALIGGKSSHPGVALGVVTIVTSLLIAIKGLTTRGVSLIIYGCTLVVVVLLGMIGVANFRDAGETWLTTCFAIFSVFLVLDMVVRTSRYRS